MGAESDKPKVDLTGLASELETLTSLRAFLRDNKSALFPESLNPETVQVANTDHVYDIIKALLERTSSVDGHPPLAVGTLRDELGTLYRNCSVVVDDEAIYRDSWCIRKIISFVKMKVRRQKVSKATFLKSIVRSYGL